MHFKFKNAASEQKETQRFHKDSSFISRDALRKSRPFFHANGKPQPERQPLELENEPGDTALPWRKDKVKVNWQQLHSQLSNVTSAWASTDNNMSFQGPAQSLKTSKNISVKIVSAASARHRLLVFHDLIL